MKWAVSFARNAVNFSFSHVYQSPHHPNPPPYRLLHTPAPNRDRASRRSDITSSPSPLAATGSQTRQILCDEYSVSLGEVMSNIDAAVAQLIAENVLELTGL